MEEGCTWGRGGAREHGACGALGGRSKAAASPAGWGGWKTPGQPAGTELPEAGQMGLRPCSPREPRALRRHTVGPDTQRSLAE